MRDDSRDQRLIRTLEAALRLARAQNRRLVNELNWAEEQVRVYRRLVERLVRDKPEESPCAPIASPPTTAEPSTD